MLDGCISEKTSPGVALTSALPPHFDLFQPVLPPGAIRVPSIGSERPRSTQARKASLSSSAVRCAKSLGQSVLWSSPNACPISCATVDGKYSAASGSAVSTWTATTRGSFPSALYEKPDSRSTSGGRNATTTSASVAPSRSA